MFIFNINYLWNVITLTFKSSIYFIFVVDVKTIEVENDQNSILSADDSSSGYESFKAIKDIDK